MINVPFPTDKKWAKRKERREREGEREQRTQKEKTVKKEGWKNSEEEEIVRGDQLCVKKKEKNNSSYKDKVSSFV